MAGGENIVVGFKLLGRNVASKGILSSSFDPSFDGTGRGEVCLDKRWVGAEEEVVETFRLESS